MNKFRILLVSLCLLSFFSLRAEKYIITGNTLNVRSQPSAQSKVIGTLQNGFEIEVLDINNDFARIDFLGSEGYVSTKFITKIKKDSETSEIKSDVKEDMPQTTEDESNKGVKNQISAVTHKIGYGVSKFKNKLKGSDEKKIEQDTCGGPISNFSKLKSNKVKFNSVITDDVFGFESDYENFKDDSGFTQGFGFRVEEHRDANTYFYLFQDYTGGGSTSSGQKILIRTGDGTVGEIEAVNSGESELYKSVKYSGAMEYHTVDYSTYRIYYLIPLDLMTAIQEYGIVKMRRFLSNGDVEDSVFTGKKFKKANQKTFDMICRICSLHSARSRMTSYDRWKQNSGKSSKKEIPDF